MFAFVGIVFVVFVFVALGAYVHLVGEQNRLDALRNEVRSAQHEHEQLRQEESLAQSSAEVLRIATDLGMVPPAESALVTPDAPIIGSPEFDDSSGSSPTLPSVELGPDQTALASAETASVEDSDSSE